MPSRQDNLGAEALNGKIKELGTIPQGEKKVLEEVHNEAHKKRKRGDDTAVEYEPLFENDFVFKVCSLRVSEACL
jgi:peptide subunit release factor 1 (eRF1)